MENSSQRSFGEQLNTWVQIIGIIIAAVWGAYTFIYKEIMLPKGAPVNITMNLQMKKIGVATAKHKDPNKHFVALEMAVSASNPSSREVYLLPSAWIVYGLKVANLHDRAAFYKDANNSLDRSIAYTELHSVVYAQSVVAVGRLFPDTSLKPGEKTTRTVIFHVPAGTYDLLDAHAVMPTSGKKGLDLVWSLAKGQDLVPTIYHVGKGDERKEMKQDKDGAYSDPNMELQMARSMAQLSLWQ